MANNNESALEKTLPKMARDIGVMKMGIMKLVAVQAGTPRAKAEQFFANQANRESAYEAKYAKSPTPTKTTSTSGSRSSGKGLGLGPSTSVIDFIKNTKSHVATLNYDKLLYDEFIKEEICKGYSGYLVDGFYDTGFQIDDGTISFLADILDESRANKNYFIFVAPDGQDASGLTGSSISAVS